MYYFFGYGTIIITLFPRDTKMITPVLGVRNYEGTVFYLLSGMPINSQADFDLNKFRYVTSNLIFQGLCSNQNIADAFHVSISQGFDRFFKISNPLPSGFYGLHHVILTLCFMALCRVKNPEQLKKHSPGEMGKLLGLYRIPDVGYFRKKLKQITDQ